MSTQLGAKLAACLKQDSEVNPRRRAETQSELKPCDSDHPSPEPQLLP